ncbi:hypothetical protein Tco_0815182 [Tanacetum coccineum]
METNNSINRSDIQRQLYKDLVEAYEADKILLDTYGDTVTIKRPRDGADDDEEPSAGTDRGSKRRRSGKEPTSTSAPSERQPSQADRLPIRYDVLSRPADQEFETVSKMNKRRNAGPTFELMKGTCRSLTELEYFCEEVYKATTEKLDWINPEGRQYPHDLRQPLPLPESTLLRELTKTNGLQFTDRCQMDRKTLVPNSPMVESNVRQIEQIRLWGFSHWGKEAPTVRRDDDALYKDVKEGDFTQI